MKTVSVVIPAYNSENSIGKVLDALQRQDYPDFRVIVVDDGSKDKTLEIAKAHRIVNLVIMNVKNLGIAKSVNMGIRASSGEIIITLHDDCVPLSDTWVSDMVRMFELDPKIAIVSSRFLIRFSELSVIDKCFSFAYFLGDDIDLANKEGIEDINLISAKCDGYKRDILDSIGLFDTTFRVGGEDIDLSCRMKKAGYRIVRNNECRVEHIFTKSGREHTINDHLIKGFKTTQNAIRVGLKYGSWYKLDSLLFILLIFFGWAVGQFYPALLIGLSWLVAKNFLKSLRYYKRYGKTDLIPSIWIFCFCFDIMAGFGWLYGIARYLLTKQEAKQ